MSFKWAFLLFLVIPLNSYSQVKHYSKNIDRLEAVSLYLDNDSLITNDDKDYTGGFALSYSGDDAAKHPFSIDPGLTWINRFLGLENRDMVLDTPFYSCEIGLADFTPRDIQTSEVLFNDRPYSNLLYLANAQQSLSQNRTVAWISSLTIGLIGTSVGGDIQNIIHRSVGNIEAKGWDNQISNGGELTLKYELLRMKSLVSNKYFHLIASQSVSIGFLTEAVLGLELRLGLMNSPWWSLGGNQNRIGSKTSPTTVLTKKRDYYWFFGLQGKVRMYNAFLQGQFRYSPHKYTFAEVRHELLEAWSGISLQLTSNFTASYVARYQTSEIKIGDADRGFFWGGLLTTYTFK